jgi:hypothetical protein
MSHNDQNQPQGIIFYIKKKKGYLIYLFLNLSWMSTYNNKCVKEKIVVDYKIKSALLASML